MPRVNLPGGRKGGCYSIKMASDGTVYRGRPGRSVVVSDEHAREIRASGNGQLGIVSGTPVTAIKTEKPGRWCDPCKFLAQPWSRQCPRCGGDTVEENE